MWRNKEIRNLSCILILLNIICAGIIVTTKSSMFCFIPILLFNIIIYLYIKKQYQHLSSLSEYLMQVYTGGEILDIRDNKEGELSILKNDIYKITCTLKEQSSDLKRDKLFLSDTLSNISHQLKTPLTSMMLMKDILSDKELAQEKKEVFIHQMHMQLERMEWLVSSLLKLSKIDANAVVFKSEQLALNPILSAVIQQLQIPIEIKDVQIDLICEDQLTIQGDREWLKEAFFNIIKNDIEHIQEHGSISITCINNPLHVKVVIADDGKGIDSNDLPFIFDRFYKGKNSSSDSVGIGLAMTKMIIQNQNGTIYVTSETGKGATFTILFHKCVI